MLPKINCLPFRAIVEYCITCDMLMPFDGNGHCYACECDNPTCELNDYDAPENFIDYNWSVRIELIDQDYFNPSLSKNKPQ